MAIYISILILFTVISVCKSQTSGKIIKTNKNSYLFMMLLMILIGIQTLRDTSVGGDLYDNYATLYENCGQVQWGDLISYSIVRGYESGYIILNKICYVFSNGNIQFLLFVIATLYIGAIGKLILKESSNRYLGLFIFFASYTYNISMNNIRSTIATSIIILALPSLLRNKHKVFLASILIAFFFHKTAIVFLFFFATVFITNTYLLIGLYLLMVALLTVGYPLFIKIVAQYLPRYTGYLTISSNGGFTFFVFLLLLVGVIAIFASKNFWNKSNNLIMFKMLICGVVLQLVSLRIPFFVRAVYYHLIALPLLIPALLEDNRLEQRSKRVLYFGVLIGFWCYYLFFLNANNTLTVPYKFCFS